MNFLTKALGSAKQKLSPVKPEELTEGDKKIAAKMAKKKAMDVAEAEHTRFCQKNAPQVEKLWREFNTKVVALGFFAVPQLEIKTSGIRPTFKFDPSSLANWEVAKKKILESEEYEKKSGGSNAVMRRTKEINGVMEDHEHRFDENGVHAGFFVNGKKDETTSPVHAGKKFSEMKDALEQSDFKLILK